ncbi:UDP-2,3-diacylglucosamine diphosphatase, partial [Thermodesulfobacteriota bacterium]
ISFLDHIKTSTRTLYILGDLFDFWFGGNISLASRYQPVLDKLKELSDASVKIVYLEGNHDFFMGTFFTDTLKAHVFSGEAELEVDGKKFYLAHGDMMNHEDWKHNLWKLFIHSVPIHILMKMLPVSKLLWIANKLSTTSRSVSAEKKKVDENVLNMFIAEKQKNGAYAVIFAHTHQPLNEPHGSGIALNPGAFCDAGSYAIYEDGTFYLKEFSLP